MLSSKACCLGSLQMILISVSSSAETEIMQREARNEEQKKDIRQCTWPSIGEWTMLERGWSVVSP